RSSGRLVWMTLDARHGEVLDAVTADKQTMFELDNPYVSGLFVYPVKSCAGTALDVAELGERGIVHDREFMVVDRAGHFLTQRQLPRMALIRPVRTVDTLVLSAPGMSSLKVLTPSEGERLPVTVWRDRVAAIDQGPAV